MVKLDEKGIEDPFYDHDGWKGIKARFPSATYEDASDCIHEGRILVKIPDATWREWFTFLMDSGWSEVSLIFGIALRSQPEDSEFMQMVQGWIDIRKRWEQLGYKVAWDDEGQDFSVRRIDGDEAQGRSCPTVADVEAWIVLDQDCRAKGAAT